MTYAARRASPTRQNVSIPSQQPGLIRGFILNTDESFAVSVQDNLIRHPGEVPFRAEDCDQRQANQKHARCGRRQHWAPSHPRQHSRQQGWWTRSDWLAAQVPKYVITQRRRGGVSPAPVFLDCLENDRVQVTAQLRVK